MPLTVISTDQHDRPAFVCDACGREITRVSEGNYHWTMGGEVYFSHRSACCCAVDERYQTPFCNQLEDFFFFLVNNLKYGEAEKRDAEARYRFFQGI